MGQSLTHVFSIVKKVSTEQAVHLVGDLRHFEQGGLQGLQIIREESAHSPSGQVLRHLSRERKVLFVQEVHFVGSSEQREQGGSQTRQV